MLSAFLSLLILQTSPVAPAPDDLSGPPDAQRSLQALERSSLLSSETTASLRRLARKNAAARQYAQAIEAYEQILRLNRRDEDAWFHLAELYAWTGDLDRAVVTYRDGLALYPADRELKNGLAQALRWMRRYDEAETLYREVLTAWPNDRDALRGLAEVSARMGNFADAGEAIGRALRLYPLDAELYKEKGNILAWQKRYSEAVETLTRAAELSPDYLAAYVTLGDVYFWMKSYERAIEAYKKALTLEPDNIDVHIMLAKAYARIGDKPLAIRHARRALDINPVNMQADELLRDLEGRRWYGAVETAGHLAEYLTFAIVFSLVYLNYRRSRRMLLRRHRFYRLFAHTVLPGVAGLAFLVYLGESYLTGGALIDPDAFHSIGESVIIVILGMSFLALLYAERRPASSPPPVILAIGAHPDDVELGCGGYLLKEKDSGASVYGLTISRGERGMEGLGDRTAEQHKAAGFLGLDNMWNLGIPDTGIGEHLREVVEAIEKKIRETHATIILTHSAYDLHSDHQAVFNATKEAARNVPTVLCYEDVGTAKEFVPNYYVDITDYMEEKIRLVAFHRTQKLKPYMDPVAVRGRASHRGLQSGVAFAEAFSINRIVS
jgi:LmbE family N-acetylglucosaminyl deacetylase/tetratricopeptide (TPR) repeat protein